MYPASAYPIDLENKKKRKPSSSKNEVLRNLVQKSSSEFPNSPWEKKLVGNSNRKGEGSPYPGINPSI